MIIQNLQNVPDMSQMTNEDIIDLFESVENPCIELMRDAYVARDMITFGNDTNDREHKYNRIQIIQNFQMYFNTNEDHDTLLNLIDASNRGDLVQFYESLNEQQLIVLGW